MDNFNMNICHSVKNKDNLNIQCCNKQKKNEILCGIHIKSKNIIFFKKTVVNPGANPEATSEINTNVKSEIKSIITEIDDKIIYTHSQLFEIITNNNNISVYSLRKSIKNCYLNNLIDTKQSKSTLIKSLKNIISKERYYISHQSYIILIQSFYRKWVIYRRKLCYNDTDILTFTCKYEILEKYFYIFTDNITNKRYAYDIRTLLQIINSEYPSCPYTFRNFTDLEKDKINIYKDKLIKNGVNIEIEKQILTLEEQIEMKIKDVFYQINMLDNYTNHEWFKNLNLGELIHLYILMEDIWNYRSNMQIEYKKNIIKSGVIFTIPIAIIKQLKSKIKLQNIILDEFIRLITEGINREEKKLGAILILTGLVEISGDAADALPHLIQI